MSGVGEKTVRRAAALAEALPSLTEDAFPGMLVSMNAYLGAPAVAEALRQGCEGWVERHDGFPLAGQAPALSWRGAPSRASAKV